MSKESHEKRRFRRYDVDSVNGKLLHSSDINILNISLHGAAIATTKSLKLDREYSLNLKFEGKTHTLRGKVVWFVLSHSTTSAKGDVVPVYKAGIRFTDVLTDEASGLIAYVEKSRPGDMDKRHLGVRFRVFQPSSAMIEMSSEYRIRTISLAGMLIESDTPHNVDSLRELEINIGGTLLAVTGRIVNQSEVKSESGTRYDIGIEFIKMLDNDRSLLVSYLEAIEKKS